MTGPEHYREAERLLAAANEQHAVEVGDPWASTSDIQYVLSDVDRVHAEVQAQAHATLAMAAASASYGMLRTPDGHDESWGGVLS